MLARDGDMLACLRGCNAGLDLGRVGLGFMGSDRFQEMRQESRLSIGFLAVTQTDTRFALATTEEKAADLREKVAGSSPLVIATTYPKAAKAAIRKIQDSQPKEGYSRVSTFDINGSVEAAPRVFKRVDAVFDLVETGETMAANGLTPIYDNLGQLTVGAVWLRGNN